MERKITDIALRCSNCGSEKGQMKKGFNRSGTQRCICKACGVTYTANPKQREYSEETRKLAIRMYYSGRSGRCVGRDLHMSKANVYNWIKQAR